ncbi:acetyltransferase, partial [Rhizobium sp. PDO1-076]
MRDLSTFKGCPAPQGVRLEGRFVTLEPYEREQHLKVLW